MIENMLSIKENLDLYSSVYKFAKKGLLPKKSYIIDISINETKNLAEIIYCYENDNSIFKYNVKDSIHINLESNNFKLYSRDNIIEDLFEESDEVIDVLSDNTNINYLRFKNKFKPFVNNYTEQFLKHIKPGNKIFYYDQKGVINEIDKENKIVTIYLHNTKKQEVVVNGDIKYLIIRKEKVLIDEDKLNPDLVKMSTKKLIDLKNVSYGSYSDYWGTPDYNIDEITNVLNHREHVERKSEKRLKKSL